MKLKHLDILLADDDADDCIFFQEALEDLPIPASLTAVHDGEELMQLLHMETYKLPNILFLDLNMPRVNGFECLTEIKEHIKLKNLPVVIFSTSFEQDVVNILYNNGAHFFIRKPPEFARFKKIVLHTISLITEPGILQPAKEDFVLTVDTPLTV